MTRPELPTGPVRVELACYSAGSTWHVAIEQYGNPTVTRLEVVAVMFEAPAWSIGGGLLVSLGHVEWSGTGLALRVTP